jgi:predicted helicase
MQANMVSVDSRHIDGTMDAAKRDDLISWLKADGAGCKVLTNVRCLSEGVDVPSLDAVMFLSTKNSQIEVVQSVGRVMRLSPGKKCGYIIIPVVIPEWNEKPENVLRDDKRFGVVWDVLNALRAHDDRWDTLINSIHFNTNHSDRLLIGCAPCAFDENGDRTDKTLSDIQTDFSLYFEDAANAIYARIVWKCGDRKYWEQWAKDIADIAKQQISRIETLVKNASVQQAFGEFVCGLRENINPSITHTSAIEMLSQHMITKPVFDALFENSEFTSHNPVSLSMQQMIEILVCHGFEKDTEHLQKFYESVRDRCKIDNAEGRQRVIVELYDQFFKNAFPKMVEQLGIVYTPVEVIDFMIRSVDDVLKKEFDRGLTSEGVHILDPFTGTGTFITRLLTSGLITPEDLERKYQREIHANEIVLLAYYIATVNVENVYHSLTGAKEYRNFPGICLTDTFQTSEYDTREHIAREFFVENTEQVNIQKKTKITVIMSNPPYSVGQQSANDNAQNVSYPKLENRIAETYVADSTATLRNSLYDTYIKAFRWATDRLDAKHGGIICFVSNGGWLNGTAMDGFRKHLESGFNRIYVFNLRGNALMAGELRRKESGNVFESGSKTSITITLLVKNPEKSSKKAEILYHDIGDYLPTEKKLDIIKNFGSVCNLEMKWDVLVPNVKQDWIDQRKPIFGSYIPIGDKRRGGGRIEHSLLRCILPDWKQIAMRGVIILQKGHWQKMYKNLLSSIIHRWSRTPKKKLQIQC